MLQQIFKSKMPKYLLLMTTGNNSPIIQPGQTFFLGFQLYCE